VHLLRVRIASDDYYPIRYFDDDTGEAIPYQ